MRLLFSEAIERPSYEPSFAQMTGLAPIGALTPRAVLLNQTDTQPDEVIQSTSDHTKPHQLDDNTDETHHETQPPDDSQQPEDSQPPDDSQER